MKGRDGRMGMNDTPRSDRTHIAIFGRRNVGKSSLINAITGQDLAIVSHISGTTTDPVFKSMEILPLGPVVLIDTPGLDDEGELGELRIKKTREIFNKTDLAVVVFDNIGGFTDMEISLVEQLKGRRIPALGVVNKSDESRWEPELLEKAENKLGLKLYRASAAKSEGIIELREAIAGLMPESMEKYGIVGDLVSPGDLVVLVVPIDSAAPKGRLILPQQQVIRDILETGAIAVVTKEYELKEALAGLGKKPRLVITDSQAFQKVAAETPEDIPLTSFSILFARSKGNLMELVRGARAVEKLKDGDRVLIAEACTHHQQADDIGRVKIPRWLGQTTGKQLQLEYSNGNSFPENLKDFALVIHCGGCMLNKRAMCYRVEQVVNAGVPIVNYGVLIAFMHGILGRATSPFPEAWRPEWMHGELNEEGL